MAKLIQGTDKRLSENLTICECTKDSEGPQGYWIYDVVAGMNVAMRVPDRDNAFVEVIEYWQRRCVNAERAYSDMRASVDVFVSQFVPVTSDSDD